MPGVDMDSLEVIPQTLDTVVDYTMQLETLADSLCNVENLLMVLLVVVGMCFGGLCCVVLGRYLKG